ncbi:hypothetical protein FGG08_005690 [Glutinoglossum americanum]|uniref:GH16 domain-containing protein n=1 Tax=Glutinoglossum americanum TaxID=1670608 RepID=A0A9P8I6R8_9PEZI|nr:hypothetical protein FGG08_005690 [Glutinoglossum americanum]
MLLPPSRLLAVTVLVHLGVVRAKYQLQENYEGLSFFDKFDFVTIDDPTNGFVDYVNEAEARKLGLIWETDKLVYIGVDHSNIIGAWCRRGRPSVRLESKSLYTHGLIIGSFWHIPGGECGTWPAFWTFGPHWPDSGEIDIIEGVHKQLKNRMALHTSDGCIVDGRQSGTWNHYDCSPATPGNAGCGVQSDTDNSFGTNFNKKKGGVYATLWNSHGIQIWFFPRDTIPEDIAKGNPDPGSWGVPEANFSGSDYCEAPLSHQAYWLIHGIPQSSSPQWPSCNCYVAMNPSAFINTYWLIESIKVYQEATSRHTINELTEEGIFHLFAQPE